MKYILHIFSVVLLSFALTGCPTSRIETDDLSEAEIYAQAEVAIQKGAYKKSIQLFEDLDKRYPYGTYSQQIQLNLIYAYYKAGDLLLAQTTIDRFIKLNPTHPNIDYVYYVRGLTNMAFDDNMIQRFFYVDRSDRDPNYALVAFKDFSQLVNAYPNSLYTPDASKRMVFLKNRLARYELSIVKYYAKRQAYVAVVNRVKQMLVDYPDTEATRAGLHYLLDANNQLGLFEEANKTLQLINANQ